MGVETNASPSSPVVNRAVECSALYHVQIEITVVAQSKPHARYRVAKWLEGGPGEGWINVRKAGDEWEL